MIKLNILPFLNSISGTTLRWVFWGGFRGGVLFPLNGVINDKSMCDERIVLTKYISGDSLGFLYICGSYY